jgi:serine/threonine protein kinase
VINIFSQLVVGVALFHSQKLVHHDIKPGNIFMDENLNVIIGISFLIYFILLPLLLIGDFGEAREFTADHTGTMTALGSMLYMAPEVMKGEKYILFLFII